MGTVIHLLEWQLTEGKQSQILHGIKILCIYVVTAVYFCNNQHKLMSHDEVILSQFSTKVTIPLILFYFIRPVLQEILQMYVLVLSGKA